MKRIIENDIEIKHISSGVKKFFSNMCRKRNEQASNADTIKHGHSDEYSERGTESVDMSQD